MSILSGLKRQDDIQPQSDTVGSRIWATGVYTATITCARIFESRGDATGIEFTFTNDVGKELKNTQWVTSGAAKGKKHYYTDKNGNNQYLPGFIIANDIARLSVDMELFELTPETRKIPLYDPELKKETLQYAEVLGELIGEQVQIAVSVLKEDHYKDAGKITTKNEIDKVYHEASGLTVVELENEFDAPIHQPKWINEHPSDFVNDTTSGTSGNSASTNAALPTTAKKSLFNK